MSYDLEIWSSLEPDLRSVLADPDEWQRQAASFCYAEARWQIVVWDPDRVLPEDVPEAVASCLPGIQFLTRISIEPISAASAVVKLARNAAGKIAKQAHGVVMDPSVDTQNRPLMDS